ncbi:uncharacterized protein V1510DRAFT_423150 [Dipodascopsis tothii]|uniref:uncharacterized protein n=1 Tax=Dipodascopsis tothii TaxID=44089 RepID=UPI0034CF77B5
MAFFFVCGATNYNGALKGYEDISLQCPRCHNQSVIAFKKREFFTLCFVPMIPTNYGPYLQCRICTFSQESSLEELDMIRQKRLSVAPEHYVAPYHGVADSYPQAGYSSAQQGGYNAAPAYQPAGYQPSSYQPSSYQPGTYQPGTYQPAHGTGAVQGQGQYPYGVAGRHEAPITQ